jgi:signal transduction histidine kinase
VKEALNNLVKHSGATTARLKMTVAPQEFSLEIADNGRGLPEGAENKGRSGLRNMRKRMEEIGGIFSIAPGSEGGIVIRLTAPFGAP